MTFYRGSLTNAGVGNDLMPFYNSVQTTVCMYEIRSDHVCKKTRLLIPERLEHESEKEREIEIPPNTTIRCPNCTMHDSIFQGFVCGTGRDVVTLRLLALAISRWCIRRHNKKTKGVRTQRRLAVEATHHSAKTDLCS